MTETKVDFKILREKYRNNSRGTKQDWGKIALTRDLTKILVYLREVESNYKKNILRGTGISCNAINDALNFLLNHGLIVIDETKHKNHSRWGDLKFYKLSEMQKRIMNGKEK